MSIYAIGDLHLNVNNEKPMDIFGSIWEKHDEKIKQDWLAKVKPEDTVIIPGDFSWALKLQETYSSFQYLEELPGKKILLKGNHDYWWQSLKKMEEFLCNNCIYSVNFLHNNSFLVEDYVISGTRGWTEDDEKIDNREAIRLELSIKNGVEQYGEKPIIAVTHYPPTKKLLNVMEKYNVVMGIYGHLHGIENEPNIESIIPFKLVSSDYLKFKLIKLV